MIRINLNKNFYSRAEMIKHNLEEEKIAIFGDFANSVEIRALKFTESNPYYITLTDGQDAFFSERFDGDSDQKKLKGNKQLREYIESKLLKAIKLMPELTYDDKHSNENIIDLMNKSFIHKTINDGFHDDISKAEDGI